MENFFDLQLSQPPENIDFAYLDDLVCPQTASDDHKYEQEIIQDGKKSHQCTFPDCGKIFKFKSEISRHIVIHFTDRPFICPEETCRKAFKRADALENHIRIHTKDLPFQCTHPDCELKFVTKSALRYHLLKHDNQKSFMCSFEGCGKTFLTKAQMKQHEKAENYHQKLAAIHTVSAARQPESIKKLKTELVDHNGSLNLSAPAPTAMKNLTWETKNPSEMDATKLGFVDQIPIQASIPSPGFSPYFDWTFNEENEMIKPAPKPVKKLAWESKDPSKSSQPVPKLAKSLAWETKNPDVVDTASISGMIDGDLEATLRKMMEENKMLKEKLEICTKMVDIFRENHELKSQLNISSPKKAYQFDFKPQFPEPEPNLSLEGSEFNFLNF